MIKLTIGIPFFNPGIYFLKAIDSILSQSYDYFELILIDDGSNDGSLEVALSIKDYRVKVISDGKNLGLPTRLNQIIDLANGEYIARMDADDISDMFRLEKQVKYLDEFKNVDIVSTGMCSISNDNKVLSYRLPKFDLNNDFIVKDAINGKLGIAHATIMARTTWYKRNKYDESAKLMEDYQLWISALIKNDLKVGYIKESLYFYREESSVKPKKLMKAYGNQLNIINDKYSNNLTLFELFKFKLTVMSKISISYLLGLFSQTDKLIKLRNRKTSQKYHELNKLQETLDNIYYEDTTSIHNCDNN